MLGGRSLKLERRWNVLLLVALGCFTSFLDAPVVSVAFPAIGQTFAHTSATTLVWVLDAYFVALAMFPVFAGRIAERYGGPRAFIGGVVAFTAASALAGAATSVGVLIGARFAQGIAAGFIITSGQALMLREFPSNERKMAVGVLAAVAGLAISISPTIGGVVVEWLGWRWIFYANLALGAITLLYAMRLLGTAGPAKEERGSFPDVLGALLQGVAVGSVVLVILKYELWGVGDWRILASVAAAAIALPLLLQRSRTHPSPVLDLQLFRNRTFAVANLGSLLFSITFYGMVIAWVLFMTDVWHYSLLTTGLTFIPGALIGAAVGGPAGEFAEKHGSRGVAITGALVSTLGLALIIASTGHRPAFFAEVLPGSLIYSAGSSAALTALLGASWTSAPPSQYAQASGINLAFRQVGGALGVAAVAAIAADASGSMLMRTHLMFTVGAGAAFMTAVVALLIAPRTETRPEREAMVEPAASISVSAELASGITEPGDSG
jgi:EmrB/QacA subfamily drug resistance transporter